MVNHVKLFVIVLVLLMILSDTCDARWKKWKKGKKWKNNKKKTPAPKAPPKKPPTTKKPPVTAKPKPPPVIKKLTPVPVKPKVPTKPKNPVVKQIEPIHTQIKKPPGEYKTKESEKKDYSPEYKNSDKYGNSKPYSGRKKGRLYEEYKKAKPREYKGKGLQKNMLDDFRKYWGDPIKFKKEERTDAMQNWWREIEVEAVEERTAHNSSIKNRKMRQEYRWMTVQERDDFHRALNLLRTTKLPGDDRTEFEILVSFHRFSEAPGAHTGAAFLCWHRTYLRKFEKALQKHVPGVTLPYWDPQMEEPLPDPSDSIMFSHHFIGNADGTVVSGPAAFWDVIPDCRDKGWYLRRDIIKGIMGKEFLFDTADVAHVVTAEKFDNITCMTDCKFEEDHALLHVFMGGHVGDITCSPNDPFFWMLHCYIDKLWEEFRETQGPDRTYYWPENFGSAYHGAKEPMLPFENYTNVDGLSDDFTSLYYYYGDRPSHIIDCKEDADCLSPAFWCNTENGRCVSRVKHGGSCKGLPHNACFCEEPMCLNDKCYCEDEEDLYPPFGRHPGHGRRPMPPGGYKDPWERCTDEYGNVHYQPISRKNAYEAYGDKYYSDKSYYSERGDSYYDDKSYSSDKYHKSGGKYDDYKYKKEGHGKGKKYDSSEYEGGKNGIVYSGSEEDTYPDR